MQKLVFVLGREPHLSVAEIAAVLGDGAEWGKAELSKEALVLPTPSRSPSPRGGEKKRISPTPDGRGGEGGWARSCMVRLGGTIKIGEVWRTVARGNTSSVAAGGKTSGVDQKTPDVEEPAADTEERVTEAIGRYILDQTTANRKVHFGYSVYDLGGGAARVREVRESLRRGAAAQKAWLASHGRKVRWVTSREPTLSSVIVQKEKLLLNQNGVEVLVLVGADRILLARTLAVQPFEEWSRRDYGRPKRDARSGMLPPKLARAMINIGISNLKFQISNSTILDPFCGSGTILTEAMALGVPKIIGTDVSTKAVRDARENVEWTLHRMQRSGDLQVATDGGLKASATTRSGITITQCDVRQLSRCVRERVDTIVTEPYLGPPNVSFRGRLPRNPTRRTSELGEISRLASAPLEMTQLMEQLRALYLAAFREFAKVLKPGGRVVFIAPVFKQNYSPIRTNKRMDGAGTHHEGSREIMLDITRDVARLGFHRIELFPAPLHDHPILRGKADLPYARVDQRVGRRILVFKLSKPQRRAQ